ncbi:MAG: amidohydrolase family protein [Oscillospiraceae bacterium]|nr:amidohydrolase family protein [Oscillospiraceae bacterium]
MDRNNIMIIDIHTHVFPDDIARGTIRMLSEKTGNKYELSGDGTVSTLLKNMDDWGIDVSVVQPVVTKQSQTRKVNEWAAAITAVSAKAWAAAEKAGGAGRAGKPGKPGESVGSVGSVGSGGTGNSSKVGKVGKVGKPSGLISFGGIYPHSSDYMDDIDFVVGLGLRGLKFHAEYQNFVLDDDHMLRVYDYALSKGLVLLHHAGFDPGYPPPFKSSPQQFARVAKAMGGGVIIAAHLGGHDQWDDVERHLVGSGIYLDTSMGFEFFPRDQFLRIVKTHGADKILFGSDAPWSNAGKEIANLRAMPLGADEIDAILGGNAARILSL